MKNYKRAGLGAFILCLLMLTLMACNVGTMTPPLEVDYRENCPEECLIKVKVIDMPDNCIALKEAKLTLTDPSGNCTTQFWKSCAPAPIGFDFKESGCYRFCVEVTGEDGSKFYYSGSFPLELKEQYNVEVRFEKGVITVAFKKLSPGKAKSWIVSNTNENSHTGKIGISLNLKPDSGEPALVTAPVFDHQGTIFSEVFYTERKDGEWSDSKGTCYIGTYISKSALVYDAQSRPILAYLKSQGYNYLLTTILGPAKKLPNTNYVIAAPARTEWFRYGSNANYATAPLIRKDSKGKIHILLSGNHGRRSDNVWRYEMIDQNLNYIPSYQTFHKDYKKEGFPIDFVLDSKDNYAVVNNAIGTYYDRTTKKIIITRRETKYLSIENGKPVYEDLTLRELGSYNKSNFSLAVDSKDMRAAAYFNDNMELSYARRVNGKWLVEPVMSGVNSKGECELAFDSNDRALISFYDSNSQSLKLARQSDSGWEITTIDSEGDVGAACVIKVDSKDNIYIAYYDKTNNKVKLAEYR